MTLKPIALRTGVALACLAPAAAWAQSSDQCYQYAAELCGTLPLGQCFQSEADWDMLNSACHGDIQRQIEMDREFAEQPAGGAGMSSDQCYQQASTMCGALSYGECFVNQVDWDILPAACHGDIQAQIEMDREFEQQANGGSQGQGAPSSDMCYEVAAELCHTIPLGDCFSDASNWNRLDQACHGDIQRQIEMDREFAEQQGGSAQSGGYVTGMAWGGKMRTGPGMEYGQIGSMTEGERIEIVGDTGQWYNNFQWYEVIAHGRQAYVWGGNFCHDGGGHMEGSGGSCN